MNMSTEVIITCSGRVDDPGIQDKISWLLKKVSTASGAGEDTFILKSVEPWNSVRVTFNLPREAAVRLQELARAGDDVLINLGILSVQIANGEQLDLNAIKELLQQELVPPVHTLPPISQSNTSSMATVSHHEIDQLSEQKQEVALKPFHAPLALTEINHTQQQQSPKLPSRPVSSESHLPAHSSISSAGFPHSSSGVKSPFLMTPSLSIGNIPTGIPSPHLGNLNKTSTAAGNLAISSSFSSVYSIAVSLGGSQRPPIQTQALQSLPNLPTPQTPPVGNFPWNLGAKPPRFLASRPPPGIQKWNPVPMFTRTPNLPTNLPGSIPSIGPIPSPSTIPNSSQETPAPKPKKKRVKRPRKPPKEKMPAIPLPPPLMPPDPKPPPSDGLHSQKPPGLQMPITMNPISPNETHGSVGKEVIPNPTITSVPQTQHTRFPFNQTQVSQSGRSDVSMTSPLLVNLLQSDFPSNHFPLSSSEQMKGTATGPVLTSHRMQTAANLPSLTGSPAHHPGAGILHPVISASQFQAPRNQPPPPFHHSLQDNPRVPLHQQGLSGEPVRRETPPTSSENFQQPFYPPIPFHHGMLGSVSTNFNRFQMSQANFQQSSPQHVLMPQSSSHPGIAENRMQTPHTQTNWTGHHPTMSTFTPMVSSEIAIPTTATIADMRNNSTQSPKLHLRDQVSKSAFDEESALAGMTEAERDTFVAAAKIAQDSKTGIDAQSIEPTLPKTQPGLKAGKLPVLPATMEMVSQGNSVSNMFAVENLAVSDHQILKSGTNFNSRIDRSSSVLGQQSVFAKVSLPEGRKLSPHVPIQVSQSVTLLQGGEVSNQNVDTSNIQTMPTSAMVQSKPPISFQSTAVPHHDQSIIPHNPFLSLPPAFVSTLPEQSQPFVTSSSSTWPVSATGTKARDPFQFDNKHRGSSVEFHGKQNLQAPVPTKPLGNYPFDWPFPNIPPPTQNLSSEGLQFMAKLAAVPNESDHQKQESSHLMPQEAVKVGKEDKPHLKALLNEISPSTDGQTPSPRAMKRLSSEEKSERKRRKSSPRPVADQNQTVSQSHGKGEQPGGSLELPRVPTAEELSFNLQQARAHSLDLLKSGTGYPPLPKTAPSSPRAKGRPKSVEVQPQYGIQQSDMFQGKHSGSSSPCNTIPASVPKSTATSSKSSGKAKESKSRSKSPKSSGNKSYKLDQPGFGPVQPVTTVANTPFAGVHEFHPPVGLNIRGPAKPGVSFQTRKTPTPGSDQKSPMSPTLPPYGPKQFQQQSQFPGTESQRISPLSTRPVSPFKSASALLSSFALSAGKAPELPANRPGPSQSPLSSPRYVTSPPLHQGSSTNTSDDSQMETKVDLQCYSETGQESISSSIDNLSHFPSPSVDPKPKSSQHPSEVVGVSNSAEQIHDHQTDCSSLHQSDNSNSSLRAPHTKQAEEKVDDPSDMPVGERQEPPEVMSSNTTTAPFTLNNVTNQHKEKFLYKNVPHKAAEVSHKLLGGNKSDEMQNADGNCSNISSMSELYSPLTSDADVRPSEHIFLNDNSKQTDISQTTENKQCKSIHKSVIVVSSHKPNVTTIGVKKLGTSSDQYSMAPGTLVSMSDSMASKASDALSLSQTSINISKSQMQTLPLTRVTKVIPISSENRPIDDMFHCGHLRVSEHSSEESPIQPIAATISYVSRPTETVISTSLSGCGTPRDAPNVPNMISQSHTHNTSSKRVSVVESSNKDAASKLELIAFEKFARSDQQSSLLGSSLPVAHYHSDSVKSDLITESSAFKECTPKHSGDVTKPFLVASHQPQMYPENSAMQDTSCSATDTSTITQLNVDILSDSSKQNTSQVVPLHVGMTSALIENAGRDTDLQTAPESLSSDSAVADSDVAHAFTNNDFSKVIETEKNISKPEVCEASSVSNRCSVSNSGTSTFPAVDEDTSVTAVDEDTSVTAVDEDTSVTAVDQSNEKLSAEVQLPTTSSKLHFEPDMQSVKGESTAQCNERPEKHKLEGASEDTLVKRIGSDHQRGIICGGIITSDSGFASTEEDSVMPSSLHQSHGDEGNEAITQKCYSHEGDIKSIHTSQPDSLELLPLDREEALDEEFETEGEGTSREDDIAIQIKNQSHGQKSPESETTELPEDHEEMQGDDHLPVTRKRSMRASGRDMYYGPIPTYKRRKPHQK